MKQDLDKLIEETAKRYYIKKDLEKLQQKCVIHIYFVENDEDGLDIVGYKEI